MPFYLLLVPVLSTVAGGLLAIRFRRSLGFLIALGAGLLLGAAFLDLLPEAIELNGVQGAAAVLGWTLAALLLFLMLQALLDGVTERAGWGHPRALGRIGGVMLVLHSLRDGMAIGLTWAASHPAAYVVAAGIAAHDLGDGMNTVILTTAGEPPRTTDYLFLAADALAPLAGGLLTAWWTFSPQHAAVLLAAAAGFFLHMATSDFLPQLRDARRQESRLLLVLGVLLGAGMIWGAGRLMERAQ